MSVAEQEFERAHQLLGRLLGQMILPVLQQCLSCGDPARLSRVSATHWSTGCRVSALNVVLPGAKRYRPPLSAYSRIGQPCGVHERVREQ
jgi:hypothetical protein